MERSDYPIFWAWIAFSVSVCGAATAMAMCILDFAAILGGGISVNQALDVEIWRNSLLVFGALSFVGSYFRPERVFIWALFPPLLSLVSLIAFREMSAPPSGLIYGFTVLLLLGSGLLPRQRGGVGYLFVSGTDRLFSLGLLVCLLIAAAVVSPILGTAADRLALQFIAETLPLLRFSEICDVSGIVCSQEISEGVRIIGRQVQGFETVHLKDGVFGAYIVRTPSPGIAEIRLESYALFRSAMQAAPGVAIGFLMLAARLVIAWVWVLHRRF